MKKGHIGIREVSTSERMRLLGSDEQWLESGESEQQWFESGESEEQWFESGESEEQWFESGESEEQWFESGESEECCDLGWGELVLS